MRSRSSFILNIFKFSWKFHFYWQDFVHFIFFLVVFVRYPSGVGVKEPVFIRFPVKSTLPIIPCVGPSFHRHVYHFKVSKWGLKLQPNRVILHLKRRRVVFFPPVAWKVKCFWRDVSVWQQWCWTFLNKSLGFHVSLPSPHFNLDSLNLSVAQTLFNVIWWFFFVFFLHLHPDLMKHFSSQDSFFSVPCLVSAPGVCWQLKPEHLIFLHRNEVINQQHTSRGYARLYDEGRRNRPKTDDFISSLRLTSQRFLSILYENIQIFVTFSDFFLLVLPATFLFRASIFFLFLIVWISFKSKVKSFYFDL